MGPLPAPTAGAATTQDQTRGARAGTTATHHAGFRSLSVQALSVGRAVAFVDTFNSALGLRGADLAEKQQVMATDPHTFFRTMPALFADDVAGVWLSRARLTPTPGPVGPVLGDFHLGNLGTFRGPTKAVWGPNDYDQARRASPEIDLLRGAASVALLVDGLGESRSDARQAIQKFMSAYAAELERLVDGGKHPGPFLKDKEARGVVDDLCDEVRSRKDRALLKRAVDHGALQRTDDVVDATPRQDRAIRQAVAAAAPGVEILDVAARRHAGGSSRGLPRAWVLVKDSDNTRRILELKMAPPSSMAPAGSGRFDADAVCARQREMMGDAMSPWTRPCVVDGERQLLREVEVEKATIDLATLKKGDVDDLAKAAGTVLARLHGADRQHAVALHAWLLPHREQAATALGDFGVDYAAHVVDQHAAFCAAHGLPVRRPDR